MDNMREHLENLLSGLGDIHVYDLSCWWDFNTNSLTLTHSSKNTVSSDKNKIILHTKKTLKENAQAEVKL